MCLEPSHEAHAPHVVAQVTAPTWATTTAPALATSAPVVGIQFVMSGVSAAQLNQTELRCAVPHRVQHLSGVLVGDGRAPPHHQRRLRCSAVLDPVNVAWRWSRVELRNAAGQISVLVQSTICPAHRFVAI